MCYEEAQLKTKKKAKKNKNKEQDEEDKRRLIRILAIYVCTSRCINQPSPDTDGRSAYL